MAEIWFFTNIGHGATKEDWQRNPIFLDQWQDVVDADPELEYIESLHCGHDPVSGTAMRRPATWSVRWVGHPRRLPVVFEWKGSHLALTLDDDERDIGEIDTATRDKAERIAAALGAELQVKRVEWSDDDDAEES